MQWPCLRNLTSYHHYEKDIFRIFFTISMADCPKCSGTMERGLIQASMAVLQQHPLQIQFLIPGTPTPLNPIKAFQQGLHGEGKSDRPYEVAAMRCSVCGYLELYAIEKTT